MVRCGSSSRARSCSRRPTRPPASRSGPRRSVLRAQDNVAVSSSDITNPHASTDQAGNPDVQFDFNPAGKTAFQNVTDQIAHRGQDVSTIGQQFNQHFAVALDNQLLTVPSIDYTVYPDGITGGNGADITAGLTRQSAHQLATMLREGPLPVKLTVR